MVQQHKRIKKFLVRSEEFSENTSKKIKRAGLLEEGSHSSKTLKKSRRIKLYLQNPEGRYNPHSVAFENFSFLFFSASTYGDYINLRRKCRGFIHFRSRPAKCRLSPSPCGRPDVHCLGSLVRVRPSAFLSASGNTVNGDFGHDSLELVAEVGCGDIRIGDIWPFRAALMVYTASYPSAATDRGVSSL